MRNYQCYVSCYVGDKLIKSQTNACWSMLNHGGFFNADYKSIVPSFAYKEIYISQFDDPATIKYQRRLLTLIDKITPCKIVTIDGTRYIKFKMLQTYNQSLILLNFIRNLWHEPIPGYAEKFFTSINKSKDQYKDPLARLTWANREACDKAFYMGHCNVHDKKLLKIKTTKELLAVINLQSTKDFLTTEEKVR